MTPTRPIIICFCILHGLPLILSTLLAANGPLSPIFGNGSAYDTLYKKIVNITAYQDSFTRAQYAPVATLETQLENLYGQLRILGTGLQAAVKPKCPPVAPAGSKVVGKYCYIVSTALLTWTAAQQACNNNGGYLAEPLPGDSVNFYNTIAAAFTPQIATIGGNSGEVWLGISQAAGDTTLNNFIYFSNRAVLQTTSQYAQTTTSSDVDGTVLVFPGTQWKAYDTTNPVPPIKAYICQWNTVL